MKKLLLIFWFLTIVVLGHTQEELTYSPVTNINPDEVWPVVKFQLDFNKTSVESLDYGQGILKSGWVEYFRGLSRARGKFLFTYADNILNIDIVDIQVENEGHWKKSSESLLFKTEYKARAKTAGGIRNILESPEKINKSKELFYNSLEIHNLFYENATELAGKRWFETYLNNKEIDWNLTFIDIKENNSLIDEKDYKYAESYVYSTSDKSFDIISSKFYIVKYTNSDKNIFTKKRTKIKVTGICKYLNYDIGTFYVKIFEPIQNDTVVEPERNSVADELLKLKNLLDAGVITEEEFKTQKEKLLK